MFIIELHGTESPVLYSSADIMLIYHFLALITVLLYIILYIEMLIPVNADTSKYDPSFLLSLKAVSIEENCH